MRLQPKGLERVFGDIGAMAQAENSAAAIAPGKSFNIGVIPPALG
jgi:hypothetical protein